jgi:hypothetical protein
MVPLIPTGNKRVLPVQLAQVIPLVFPSEGEIMNAKKRPVSWLLPPFNSMLGYLPDLNAKDSLD